MVLIWYMVFPGILYATLTYQRPFVSRELWHKELTHSLSYSLSSLSSGEGRDIERDSIPCINQSIMLLGMKSRTSSSSKIKLLPAKILMTWMSADWQHRLKLTCKDMDYTYSTTHICVGETSNFQVFSSPDSFKLIGIESLITLSHWIIESRTGPPPRNTYSSLICLLSEFLRRVSTSDSFRLLPLRSRWVRLEPDMMAAARDEQLFSVNPHSQSLGKHHDTYKDRHCVSTCNVG